MIQLLKIKKNIIVLASFIQLVLFFKQGYSQLVNINKDTVVYAVGYAHLDTEWRWDYQTTINDYLKNTLKENFKLFEKYPSYIFNFSGANRYMMIKEYYPEDYKKLKQYIKQGNWFPSGSSMEENDVLAPSAESCIRQILYGSKFFLKEFQKTSAEFMLPDCFGFPASLPSILAHCGLKGFSTQKLSWNSAKGIPFTFGIWEGPDKESVIAAFNPGSYIKSFDDYLYKNADLKKKIYETGKKSGLYLDYLYYGVGDQGGAPDSNTVSWIEKSIKDSKDWKIVSSTSDKFFLDFDEQTRLKLPRYSGELLLINHSAGSITSHAYMKRWNRKNELLAYKAEAASVFARWAANTRYPIENINEGWRLMSGCQFHDILPGTSIPRAYEFSWNDEIVASNLFRQALVNSVEDFSRLLDTRGEGVPVIVYNPLPCEREEPVEATVTMEGKALTFVKVFDDEKEVPSQVISIEGNKVHFLFLAKTKSMGYKVFNVQPSLSSCAMSDKLKISDRKIENEKYSITVDENGEVSSILDKEVSKELLKSPLKLAFLFEMPREYPAWNMDWKDRNNPPTGYVDGEAKITIAEKGPVRVTLAVERTSRGSVFTQYISLSKGTANNRIDFNNHIDWLTKETSLKAVFPLNVSNKEAVYSFDIGTLSRGNNDSLKYEVPFHQWFDLTNTDSTYGVSVLAENKYGSDKPSDNELRLTLLYTPGTQLGYKDQATLDFGKHQIHYSLYGHKGTWKNANTPQQAARFNNNLTAFQATKHNGTAGKEYYFLSISNPDIAILAVKKAENSNLIIVRLVETKGKAISNAVLSFGNGILEAWETNGVENAMKKIDLKNGSLTFDMQAYHPKTIAIKPIPSSFEKNANHFVYINLPYNTDVFSSDINKSDGSFDYEGHSIPAELIPDTIYSGDISFISGPKNDRKNNALSCAGQKIALPQGNYNALYLLAASTDTLTSAKFILGDKDYLLNIEKWSGFIGQWDNRRWEGEIKKLDYVWDNKYAGVSPGYVRNVDLACYTTHRHLKNGENEAYIYSYIYKYKLPLSPNSKELVLPNNEKIKIIAITVANIGNSEIIPAVALFDTLNYNPKLYTKFLPVKEPVIIVPDRRLEPGSKTLVTIKHDNPIADIYYRTNDAEQPDNTKKYTTPFYIDSTCVIQAYAGLKNRVVSNTSSYNIIKTYQINKIEYLIPLSPNHKGGKSDNTLFDLETSNTFEYNDPVWQAVEGTDFDIIIDLGAIKPIDRIAFNCMKRPFYRYFLPIAIDISVSDDKVNYKKIISETYPIPNSQEDRMLKRFLFETGNIKGRYIHLSLKNMSTCPLWHKDKGKSTFINVDEIMVE